MSVRIDPTPKYSNNFSADDFAYDKRPKEGCGVVAVYNHPDAARLTSLGLFALQHRGQESAGVATHADNKLHLKKGPGKVTDVFTSSPNGDLPGKYAIGHVRYSTAGGSAPHNAQPLVANYRGGHIAVAHNGNLTNAEELASSLEATGAIFQSTADSELLIHLIAQNRSSEFSEAFTQSLQRLHGAFSLVMLHNDEIYAVKDSHGFRPLCLGKIDDGWIVASESCALDIVGATFLREFQPGEAIHFRNGLPERFQAIQTATPPSACVFETIYYSRPDSIVSNKSIYHFRQKLGEELANEHPVDADVVIPVPDSSNPAAMGYSRASNIPMENGLLRSHYVGRTFITPGQQSRVESVKLKFNPIRETIEGKRVVMVDDSVVRGTTARKIMRMVREAGAKEIHFRITAPPWKQPCYYGIDTPDEELLIANQMDEKHMAEHFGVDSIGFISMEGLMRSVPQTMKYCTACFNGLYPDGRPRSSHKSAMVRKC